MSPAKRRDAIIIGGGHNGLVTACYLARAGLSVLVLERRYLVGGACVTEETFPGFKVSTAAYVNSLFRKEIVRDLDLGRHGFEVLPRNPSSFTPYPDGRSLMLGPDPALNEREIAKFSARDAARYPEYEAMLERVAALVEPTITMTAPDLQRPGLRGLLRLLALGRSFRRLGPGASEAVEVLTGAARDILDRWFESTELKATLATDAIIGAMASPVDAGHRLRAVSPRHGRDRRAARRLGLRARRHGRAHPGARARGGASLGVEIRCEAEVARILVRDGRAAGVVLANGEELRAPARGQQCRRPRHVPAPRRGARAARRVPGRRRAHQLRERLAEDQRRAGRAAGLPRPARDPARAPAPGHDPHLSRPRLHRARLRRRQVRPALRAPGARVHHPLGGGRHGGAAGPAPHVDLRAVRAVRARARATGTSSGSRSPTAASSCSTSTRPTSAARSSPARC